MKVLDLNKVNDIESLCSKLTNSIDGIISSSIVNLQDGSILASSFKDANNILEMNKNISSATMEILKSHSAQNIQKCLDVKKSESGVNHFKEIFISSTNSLFFIRVLENTDIAIFVISNKTSNQGLIWSEIKMSIPKIREIVN